MKSVLSQDLNRVFQKKSETMDAFGLKSLKIGHYVLRAETAPVIGISKFHALLGEN